MARDKNITEPRWRQLPVLWKPGQSPLSENRLIRIKEILDDSLSKHGKNCTLFRLDVNAGAEKEHLIKLIESLSKKLRRLSSKLHFVLISEMKGLDNLHYHLVFIFDQSKIDLEKEIKKTWKKITGFKDDDFLNFKPNNPDHAREVNIHDDYEQGFLMASYLAKNKYLPPKILEAKPFVSSNLRYMIWIASSRIRRIN